VTTTAEWGGRGVIFIASDCGKSAYFEVATSTVSKLSVSKSLNTPMNIQKRTFISLRGSEERTKIKSTERIGPHSLDVISLIVGSILGNSHLEKSKTRLGTRIIFVQCNNNVEYLMWFHKFLAARGYCNPNKPKLTKIIAKNNKVLYMYRIISYTFSSFN
jgi:hypothetical protein